MLKIVTIEYRIGKSLRKKGSHYYNTAYHIEINYVYYFLYIYYSLYLISCSLRSFYVILQKLREGKENVEEGNKIIKKRIIKKEKKDNTIQA